MQNIRCSIKSIDVRSPGENEKRTVVVVAVEQRRAVTEK